jgi:type I restriction enzyme S subunit
MVDAIHERSTAYDVNTEQSGAVDILLNNLETWTSATRVKANSGRGKNGNGNIELTGVESLRELILELAVRGKLVPQNPAEECAMTLLERIEAEKVKLAAQGKLKKQRRSPVAEDESPLDLPASWMWVRLPDIYQPISPSGKKLKTSEVRESGSYPVVDQGKTLIEATATTGNLSSSFRAR